MSKINVGIVGGRFGASFPFHAHPDARVVAVCDLREDRRDGLQQRTGAVRAYEKFDDLLADKEVEAVGIFTPVPLHASMSIATLKAGKHVICAVPAAITLGECEQLIETVRETGLTYMMAETSYYYPQVITCRQWQQKEQRFGTIFYAQAEYFHDVDEVRVGVPSQSRSKLIYDEKGEQTWRYGFPPMLYITHSSSAVISVTGERLTEVTALGWGEEDSEILKNNPYDNPFYNTVALFKTSGGNSARICEFRCIGSPGTVRFEFYGTEMSFIDPVPGGRDALVGYPERAQVWDVEDHFHILPEALRKDTGHRGSHPFLVHEFIRSIVEERLPAINIREALAYTAPGICAHESALRNGEWVKIPDFGAGF